MTEREKILGILVSEGLGLGLLLGVADFFSALLFILFHTLASLLLSLLLYPVLPRRYREGGRRVFVLIWTLAFSFGPLGIVSGPVFYFLLLKKTQAALPFQRLVTQLHEVPKAEKRVLGEGGIATQSAKLVLFLSQHSHPGAVRLMKTFLSSDDDEARMLTFATIATLEEKLFAKINLFLQELEKAQEREGVARIHHSLGELYWELVFLGIADKELEEFYLAEAFKHLSESVEIEENDKVLYLLGRVNLRLRDYENAEECFRRALDKGMPLEKLGLYLMEVYFLNKDWKKMGELLKLMDCRLMPDPKAYSILRAWSGQSCH